MQKIPYDEYLLMCQRAKKSAVELIDYLKEKLGDNLQVAKGDELEEWRDYLEEVLYESEKFAEHRKPSKL